MPEILFGIILEFFEMLLGLLLGLRDRKKGRKPRKKAAEDRIEWGKPL